MQIAENIGLFLFGYLCGFFTVFLWAGFIQLQKSKRENELIKDMVKQFQGSKSINKTKAEA